MSKRSKARRDDLIRSMEGLAVLKVRENTLAASTKPKPGKPMLRYTVGLMAMIIFAAAGIWLLGH
jgi:hypothetical protein